MSSPRDMMLARIRTALAAGPAALPPRPTGPRRCTRRCPPPTWP
ncbi:MAG: hypothetical protein WKG07_12610 [Hymenobacter sp.]